MAMTAKKWDGIYMSTYRKWLDKLELIKYKSPELYAPLSDEVREYRQWVADVSGMDNLPEVPKFSAEQKD